MPVSNALLVRYDGGYDEVIDAGSISASGSGIRHETMLSVSDVRSLEEATRIAEATLTEHARERTAVEANLEPLDSQEIPYIGFDVGDTITVDDENDAPATTRVRAISVSEDAEGAVIWTPELGDLIEEPTVRAIRWLKRMDNGTLGGRSESAQPVTDPVKGLSQAPRRGGGRPYATFVIAAFDSVAPGANGADFVCDGVDAGVGINAAVAAMNPDIGGRILLLEGTYPLLTTPWLSTGGTDGDITLEGQGYATHLKAMTPGMTVVRGDWSHEQIANLRIDGNAIAAVGVDFDLGVTGTYHRLRSCWIHGSSYGILPADLVSLRITDCDIYGNAVAGYYMDRPQDLQILASRFEANGEHIHFHDPSDAGDDNSAIVSDCVLRDATTIGIFTRSRWAVISNNLMLNNPIHVSGFHGETQTVQVLGNRIFGGNVGVHIDESARNQIHGNTFSSQAVASVEIHDASDRNSVRSNVFVDSAIGVDLNANLCNDNVVSNNDFTNCGTDIADAAAGTITTDNTTA